MCRIVLVVILSIFFTSLLSQHGHPGPVQAANPLFGDGSDGAIAFSTSTQFTPPADAVVDSATSGTTTATLSSGSGAFVPGERLLIHQSRGANAGSWEINTVQSYALGVLTTATPLAHSYVSSGPDRAQVLVVPQYSNVTVNSGVSVIAKPWNGATGGILAFFANGTVTIQQGASINANIAGFKGSTRSTQNVVETGGQGEGTAGPPNTQSTAANGNGGSGGQGLLNSADGGSGGGNGTTGSAGSGSTGGGAAGTADLMNMVFGGGGGEGGSKQGGVGGIANFGGNGGGIVFVAASAVAVPGSADFGSDGQIGFSSSDGNATSGGGGAGGSILLRAATANFGNAQLHANGGPGAVGGWAPGYPGAVGRIRVEYCTSMSGGLPPSPSPSIAQISCVACPTPGDCDHDSSNAVFAQVWGDGCTDDQEASLVPPTNPRDPWDFYSVPVPALLAAPNPRTDFRDSVVAGVDAQAVFAYFKAGAQVGTTVYDEDLNANGVEDGVEYDRTVLGAGLSGPPDGVVGAREAQVAFAQFERGYHC